MDFRSSQAIAGSLPRRSKLGPLVLAVITLTGILLVAIYIVVLVPEFKSDPEFVARKKIYLPQKELQHKVALAEFQNAASSPMQLERISTSSLLPNALPSLPDMPRNEFSPIERNPAAMQSDALLGQSGVLGALQGLNTESSSASLFGVEDSGQRILILFDNSRTVLNKADALGIDDAAFVRELSQLVDGLNANTLFGFVPFARHVGTYRDYMIAAGARNKQAVKLWFSENLRSTQKTTKLLFNEDGIQGALTVAFQMEPEVIFILSDGDFYRNQSEQSAQGPVPWEDVERTLRNLVREYGIEPRIHFIGFQVNAEDAQALEKIAKRYKGQFSALGAK